MNEFLLRIRALFRRRQFDQDLRDELAFHMAMRDEKSRGSAENARDSDFASAGSNMPFGNPTRIAETCREMRTFSLLETFWHDVRYGARLLRRSPMFTAIAVLTLALGIGANTAIFSLTYQVLLQLLPVPHPEELVLLRSPGPRSGSTSSDGDNAASFSYPMYREIREQTGRVFSGVLARSTVTLSISGLGNTERSGGELVSGNYFDVLGVPPALGRVFSDQDETAAGANAVAVLSYGYWTRRFANDPSVLNKQININGTLFTIVGVSRAGFTGIELGELPDIFIPITMKQQITPNSPGLDDHRYHWAALLARLKPGLRRSSAEAALQAGFHSVLDAEVSLQRIPEKNRQQFLARKLLLEDGSHGRPIVQRDTRAPLLILTAMVGLVLIIGCVNLAGLLVARGEARQREIAVRLSLGATRRRLFRQLLTEGFLLALAGGAVGLALGAALLRFIVQHIPRGVGIAGLRYDLSVPVLLVALALSLLTTLLFAVMPAFRLIRLDPQPVLKDQSSAASAAASVLNLRKWLTVFQVVFTTVLLVTAGLFTESLFNVQHVDLGLNPDHLLEFGIAPELSRYTPAQTTDFIERLRTAIAALPGVRSVSAAEIAVMSDSTRTRDLTIQGYTPAETESTDVGYDAVGPNYFSTMNIPLLAGREFSSTDTAASPHVAIINEKLAERYFAGRNPLGQHIHFGRSTDPPEIEIVGVVKENRHANPREVFYPFAFVPYTQVPGLGHVTFYVRTVQDPVSAAGMLRSAVASLDSSLPVYGVMTVYERRDESTFAERLMAVLCLASGSLAALLAALGLYGVLAYMVARRTREIGIRVALGATRNGIAWMVLRELLRLTAIGLAVGLIAGVLVGHFIRSQLFDVSGAGPLILALSAVLLAVVALLAGTLPALRAARVQPTVALRYE